MITNFMAEEFNKQRYHEMGKLTPADRVRIQKALELLGNNRKILDLGCFDGTIGEKIIKGGNDVYGLDISAPAVKRALKRGIKAQQLNIEETWPYEDSFFDAVFAGEIIEHLFDTDRFLEEIKRILNPKGFLILTTPNLASLGRRLFLFLGKNPLIETDCLDAVAGHVRYFTRTSLFELLGRHDFEVVRFESTVVNFNVDGTIHSRKLAKIFPTLGSSLIVKCKVKK